MKILPFVASSILIGVVIYALGLTVGSTVAFSKEPEGDVALEWRLERLTGRVEALEERSKKVDLGLDKLRKVANRVSLLNAELEGLRKIEERLKKAEGQILYLKNRFRVQFDPTLVNPYGIARRWQGKTPDGITLIIYPITDPEFLGSIQELFRSKHNAVLLKIVNERDNESFRFEPKAGRFSVITRNEKEYRSLDARAVYLMKGLGPSLESLPEIYKDTRVLPGASKEMVILFSPIVDFAEIKDDMFMTIGKNKVVRIREFKPKKETPVKGLD